MRIGLTRRSVAQASAMLVACALAACGSMPQPSPIPPSAPDRSADPPAASSDLLVLLGTPGHMRLTWLAGNAEAAVRIADEDGRWVSGSPSRGLVMTVGPAGRIVICGPFTAGHDPIWHEIPVARDARQWLGQPLADAVADPAGGRIAVVAADAAAGLSDGHLVILDPPPAARLAYSACPDDGMAGRRPGLGQGTSRSRPATWATRRRLRSSIPGPA